ncbi:MAG: acyltransferase [Anaerolineae bacterium]|jgi:peptidoglycan/LPS O-acetylase OafA/YrhL|nr:acyltransferase [Anaerolineae bacterium]MBT7070097.1 acyltransferase [Anaerolineae bacterium]MBT7992003.1 acyltransferase [Anaerolineae bacterium]
MTTETKKRNVWQQAAHLAEKTPENRNRYVDFLRAFSIIIVIFGHWLVVAPYIKNGEILLPDILSISPWTQWLTWIVQVMPVFFIVGGFSNSISWQSAQKRGEGYSVWFAARLRRLISPVLPVLVIWAIIGIIAKLFNADTTILQPASTFALLPAWFLVVYIVVVSLVPLVYRAWERFKLGSFWILAAAAILVDIGVFLLGWKALGWVNYIFVWVAVHQLGVAWQAQSMGESRKTLLWAFWGIAALIALVMLGPYPISMVSVQGEEISNTLPPNLTMLALGVFQGGILLSLEKPLRKWLSNLKIWTATVLINGMIMTLFLWHVTVLILVAGLALALGGIGLGIAPGTLAWWLTRPIWILILGTVLLTLVPIFLRYERLRPLPPPSTTPTWRLLLGALLFCAGLAILTLNGITSDNWLGIRIVEFTLPFIGAVFVGILSTSKA